MKSASEKLVVLNKKVADLKAVKAENAQLKKQLAAGGLEKVKKQKEALQEKVEELKGTVISGKSTHMSWRTS